MSALVIGLDLIMKYCRHLKYIKNVIMITDGRGSTDWSQSNEIAEQIKKESISVSILYPPFPLSGTQTTLKPILILGASALTTQNTVLKKRIKPLPRSSHYQQSLKMSGRK